MAGVLAGPHLHETQSYKGIIETAVQLMACWSTMAACTGIVSSNTNQQTFDITIMLRNVCKSILEGMDARGRVAGAETS